jgi:hypothetical protein
VDEVLIDRKKSQALIQFQNRDDAMEAVVAIEGTTLDGKKVDVGFADYKCRQQFIDGLKMSGQVSSQEIHSNAFLAGYDYGTEGNMDEYNHY